MLATQPVVKYESATAGDNTVDIETGHASGENSEQACTGSSVNLLLEMKSVSFTLMNQSNREFYDLFAAASLPKSQQKQPDPADRLWEICEQELIPSEIRNQQLT